MNFPGLYPCFKKWTEFDRIFLYSDPHFSETDMYQIRNKFPYDVSDNQLKNFDAFQINNINSLVGRNDMLIILGDIGRPDILRDLKTNYKVLVTGNHDLGSKNYERSKGYLDRTVKPYLYVEEDNRLFDEIYEGPVYIHKKIVLSHEPINPIGALNIHGHKHDVHNLGKFNEKGFLDIKSWAECFREESKNAWLNVAAEMINYYPINIKDILTSGVLKKIDSLHRLTIDDATERKAKRND